MCPAETVQEVASRPCAGGDLPGIRSRSRRHWAPLRKSNCYLLAAERVLLSSYVLTQAAKDLELYSSQLTVRCFYLHFPVDCIDKLLPAIVPAVATDEAATNRQACWGEPPLVSLSSQA